MLTLGTGIYWPSAAFWVMRSYLPQVSVSGVLGTPTVVANHVYWINQMGSGQDYHIIYNPDFWSYGRGRWQITDVIDQCWYEVPPNPTKNPVTFILEYKGARPNFGSSLLFMPWGALTTPIDIPIETESQPYWWLGTDE